MSNGMQTRAAIRYPARLSDDCLKAFSVPSDCTITLPLGAVIDEVVQHDDGREYSVELIADGERCHLFGWTKAQVEELLVNDGEEWAAAEAEHEAIAQAAADVEECDVFVDLGQKCKRPATGHVFDPVMHRARIECCDECRAGLLASGHSTRRAS